MKSSRWKCIVAGGLLWPLSLSAQIEWPVKEIEFKAKPEHTRTVAKFPFVNKGKETVTITQIQSSCGCTAALPNNNKREYAPGEKGEIEAVFDHGDRIGFQQKQITVTTSDAPTMPTVLTLKVHIPEILKIDPPFVFWTPQDKASPKLVRLTVGVEEPVRIIQVRTDHENFKAELKVVEEGRSYEVLVTAVNPDVDSVGMVLIQTDYPRQNPRVHRLQARVIPPPPEAAPAAP